MYFPKSDERATMTAGPAAMRHGRNIVLKSQATPISISNDVTTTLMTHSDCHLSLSLAGFNPLTLMLCHQLALQSAKKHLSTSPMTGPAHGTENLGLDFQWNLPLITSCHYQHHIILHLYLI